METKSNLIISGKECMDSYEDYFKNNQDTVKQARNTYDILCEILSYHNVFIKCQPITKVCIK